MAPEITTRHDDREPAIRGGLSQDLLGGLFFLALALAALYLLWDHPMMRGTRVSTGYFPKILITLIACMAVALIVRGLRGHGIRVSPDRLRPVVFVIGSFLAFGFLITKVGFFVSCMVSVILACLADPEYRPLSALIVSVTLSTAATLLFVGLIEIPVRVFPW